MEALALGEVGLDVDYFYSLTPRQFDNLLKGYRKKEEERYRSDWERSRFQMYYSLVAMRGAEKIKLTDVLSFDWDKEIIQRPKKLKTKEERENYWKEFDAKKRKVK